MSDATESQPHPGENAGLAAGARGYGPRAKRGYPARRIARSGEMEPRKRVWVRNRFVRFVLWGFVAIAVFVGGLLIFHEPLLRAAAQAWVVSDEPAPGDAIIILKSGVKVTLSRTYRDDFRRRMGSDI